MTTDTELLRRCANDRSEQAFIEVVQRHLPLVCGTAVRQAGGTHRAEGVAQMVFIDLARKATTLTGRTSH